MIHQTAIIDPTAKIHSSVSIGPYSVIGPDVEIGENTEIKNNVTIEGPTKIGSGCRIFPYAAIGLEPQDKKFHGENSCLEIGDNNLIREFVTINRGTDDGIGYTKIGNDGWFMAYSHIAHDCIIGDGVTFSNNTTLAGHVTVGNYVVCGGFTAIHQFCSVGDYAFTGAQSIITQDVVPYMMAAGNPLRVVGLNKVGLERKGFDKESLKRIKDSFKIFFKSGLAKTEALAQIEEKFKGEKEIELFTNFINKATRGVCR